MGAPGTVMGLSPSRATLEGGVELPEVEAAIGAVAGEGSFALYYTYRCAQVPAVLGGQSTDRPLHQPTALQVPVAVKRPVYRSVQERKRDLLQ